MILVYLRKLMNLKFIQQTNNVFNGVIDSTVSDKKTNKPIVIYYFPRPLHRIFFKADVMESRDMTVCDRFRFYYTGYIGVAEWSSSPTPINAATTNVNKADTTFSNSSSNPPMTSCRQIPLSFFRVSSQRTPLGSRTS